MTLASTADTQHAYHWFQLFRQTEHIVGGMLRLNLMLTIEMRHEKQMEMQDVPGWQVFLVEKEWPRTGVRTPLDDRGISRPLARMHDWLKHIETDCHNQLESPGISTLRCHWEHWLLHGPLVLVCTKQSATWYRSADVSQGSNETGTLRSLKIGYRLLLFDRRHSAEDWSIEI